MIFFPRITKPLTAMQRKPRKNGTKPTLIRNLNKKTQNLTAQQMQRTGDAQMYIAGDSMTEIIDNAGCPGTAEFANQTIQIYTA